MTRRDPLIVSFDAYSPDENLAILVVPAQDLDISGDMARSGAWLASDASPMRVEAPLFLEAGLVDVRTTIISIDDKPVSGTDTTFQILFTMGKFIPFTVDVDGDQTQLMFATYFDRIEGFGYDPRDKRLTAQMPFDWNGDFIESIPFVHAEYYVPKTVDIFDDHEIIMTINGISYFGTIDRSGDEEIVVHFLLSSPKLLKLIDQIPQDQRDRMIFGIESGKMREQQKEDASLEGGDKAIALSSEEDWKFHLTLSPKGRINPGNDIVLNIEFRDPVTNTIIPQITYDLDVFLNGQTVSSQRGLETPDGRDSVRVTFDDVGAVIARISNVNDFDTSGEFSFKVTASQEEVTGDYLVDIPAGTSLPGCEGDDSCYLPFVLDMAPGDTILWNNGDDTAHTVTSGTPEDGPSGIFDSGVIAAGEEFAFELADVGTIAYYCTLHPWMTGHVTVGDAGPAVPAWIKNSAGWWADGSIGDDAFVQGIQYLIKEDILQIPATSLGKGSSSGEIPAWIKNSAGWWAEGAIDDDAFVQGIQYLITNGILHV